MISCKCRAGALPLPLPNVLARSQSLFVHHAYPRGQGMSISLSCPMSSSGPSFRWSEQGCSQPHSPGGGQEFHFPNFFLKFLSIFLIFPQTLLILFLILALLVGESPTRKGPGYATGSELFGQFTSNKRVNPWNWSKQPIHNNIFSGLTGGNWQK